MMRSFSPATSNLVSRFLTACAVLGVGLALLPAAACKSTGVGDPCTPEAEYNPEFNGFSVDEVNFESKSFQCQTRLCLVNHFQGRVSCQYGQDVNGAGPAGYNGCTVPNDPQTPIVGDPNLAPETSTSTELALLWDNHAGFNAGLTLFHTSFRDKVMDVQPLDENGDYLRWSEDPNYRVYYWTNVDKARIRGTELSSRWKPSSAWTFNGHYTWTDSKQLSGNYRGYALARTPKHLASLRAQWQAHEALSLWAGANYHGKEINAQLRTGAAGKPITTPDGRIVREYGAYATADLGSSWRIDERFTVNAALYNLTDRRLDVDSYNAIENGRRLWFGVNVKL